MHTPNFYKRITLIIRYLFPKQKDRGRKYQIRARTQKQKRDGIRYTVPYLDLTEKASGKLPWIQILERERERKRGTEENGHLNLDGE